MRSATCDDRGPGVLEQAGVSRTAWIRTTFSSSAVRMAVGSSMNDLSGPWLPPYGVEPDDRIARRNVAELTIELATRSSRTQSEPRYRNATRLSENSQVMGGITPNQPNLVAEVGRHHRQHRHGAHRLPHRGSGIQFSDNLPRTRSCAAGSLDGCDVAVRMARALAEPAGPLVASGRRDAAEADEFCVTRSTPSHGWPCPHDEATSAPMIQMPAMR